MKKFTAVLTVLTMLLAALFVATPAQAKDITWGKAPSQVVQTKDITWGKTKQAKDITWGKAVPLSTVLKKGYSNDVTHAADDSGWAGPIHIVCNSGTHRYLYPGESSAFDQKACSISGVDRWIVPSGHTYYCKNYLPPYQNRYIYVGSTDVPSASSWKCYDQKAL